MGMSVDCSLSITDDFAMCDVANFRCFLTKMKFEFGVFSSLLPCNSLKKFFFLLILNPVLPLRITCIKFPVFHQSHWFPE